MLSEKAKMVNEGLNEMMSTFIRNYYCDDMFASMSTEDFELMQKSMCLMKSSMELMEEQAKAIDEINRKLDTLLASK